MKLGRNLKQPKVGEHYFIASNDYQKTKIKKGSDCYFCREEVFYRKVG